MENEVALAKEMEPPSETLEPPSEELEPPSGSTALADNPLVNLYFGPEQLKLGLLESAETEAPVLPVPGRGTPSFKIGRTTKSFRRTFFPKATNEEWNDWRWQFRNRIRDIKTLTRMVRLSDDEKAALSVKGGLPLGITPYYASLIDPYDPAQPVRRTVVPVVQETCASRGEADDPLGEDGHSPVPGLVHRYPDRVLFLVSGVCASYCRYCTRSRVFGGKSSHRFTLGQWEKAIEYIEANTQIRDVLLSGGDPLMLTDEKIEWLLSRLRRIPHVEILRIGTKTPAVLPQRITPALTRMLRRYHPLWMSIHFTHPDELTPESAQACKRLADAGIPLGSQTVLLKGVNDDVDTMKRLVHGLMKVRVKPYYLYQCDPITGSGHFRTPVEKGVEIIRGLRGHTSGYAVPTFVIDAPGGGGKVPVSPDYVVGREDSDLVLTNYEGKRYRYPDGGNCDCGEGRCA
jgi:lysine 2,3-aminomutase